MSKKAQSSKLKAQNQHHSVFSIQYSVFSHSVATVISRLSDPVFMIPGMLVTAVAWSIFNGLRWRFILVLLLIDGLIPALYFVHLLTTGEISDWDTTKRQQRFKLYGFTLAVHAVGVVFAAVLGKIILAKILFSFWVLAAAYTAITLFWKISLHTGVFATAITFAAALWGRNWLYLGVFLPVIAWSRFRLKKHTPAQVVIGAILGPAILLALFNLLDINQSQISAPSQEGVFSAP